MRWPGIVVLSLVAVPTASSAGPLGKVTKGISDKTESSSKGSSGGGGSGQSDSRSSKSNETAIDVGVGGCVTCGPVTMASAAAPAAVSSKNAPSRPVIDLYFAGHRVEDSDGALAGLARVRHGGFAIEFSDTSYWERRPTLDNPDDRIRMDMWSFNLQGRLVAVNRTALWVVGGIGATSSTEFPTIQGPLLGGRITHDFAPGLAGELGARWYVLEQGVRATELRASVRASVFTIGYRRLEFNVGPPLQGPEAGVTLRF